MPLTGGMNMTEMLAAVTCELYGPLQPGQEPERWQVVNQVKTQISAGDTTKDGAVDEFHVVSDYEGTKLNLVMYPLAYDKRVPDACPERVELDEAKWRRRRPSIHTHTRAHTQKQSTHTHTYAHTCICLDSKPP